MDEPHEPFPAKRPLARHPHVTDSFWDTGASGLPASAGGGGRVSSTGGGTAATPVLVGGATLSVPMEQGAWQRANGSGASLAPSVPAARQLSYRADGRTVTLTGEAGAHTLQFASPTASGLQAFNVSVTVGGPLPSRVPAGEASDPLPLGPPAAVVLVLGGVVRVSGRASMTI